MSIREKLLMKKIKKREQKKKELAQKKGPPIKANNDGKILKFPAFQHNLKYFIFVFR